MIETKLVQKFGNSAHIILPKDYIGKRIKFIAEPKKFEDIKSEVLEILKPYLDNLIAIYLYGSYARNEQTIDSDIDILVITNTKLTIADKIKDYSIISVTVKELDNTLKNNAVLVLPIIKEAKTIINPQLLEKYKEYKFNKENTKRFMDSCKRVLELNKKGIQMNFEIGSLIYSLILRVRGLLMIKLILKNKLYSKSSLFSYLKSYSISDDKIEELYTIYGKERDNVKIIKSNVIAKEDIKKLLNIFEELLKNVGKLLI